MNPTAETWAVWEQVVRMDRLSQQARALMFPSQLSWLDAPMPWRRLSIYRGRSVR